MSKKKKNIIISLLVIAATALVCLGIYLMSKELESNDTSSSYVVSINANELQEKINNKESFVLIYIQTGCSHCEEYLPIVKEVAEEKKYTIYTINIREEENTTEEAVTIIKNVANISGTPTTVFIHEGEEKTSINRLVGTATKSKLEEKLVSEGYINE